VKPSAKIPIKTSPSRPGAPYDIAPFDVVGAQVQQLNDVVTDRCGNPQGAPDCLTVTLIGELIEPVEACTITALAFDPVPGPPGVAEGEEQLQRGTRVSATVDCAPPTDEALGRS